MERPKEAGHLRPISLRNVIYKIISKIIVHRLKPTIRVVVSPFQNACVHDGLLDDECLIAHEMMSC